MMVDVSLIVDQRDVQRKGGVCAKSPISCLIKDMLENIGLEPRNLVVFDVTYGEGRFYLAWRPRILIGADPYIHDWKVEPDIFIKKPVWSSWKTLVNLGLESRINLVVVDPPWTRYRHRHRQPFNHILGTPETIIMEAVKASEQIGAEHLLIHYKEPVNLEAQPILEIRYKYLSRYLKNNGDKTTWFAIYKCL